MANVKFLLFALLMCLLTAGEAQILTNEETAHRVDQFDLMLDFFNIIPDTTTRARNRIERKPKRRTEESTENKWERPQENESTGIIDSVLSTFGIKVKQALNLVNNVGDVAFH